MSDEGPRGNWTPRFILGQDGRIIFTATGKMAGRQKMWPKIVEVTGTKA